MTIAAGRRSGKTEIMKRYGVKLATKTGHIHDDGLFVFAAPTHKQARSIFWNDVKALVPAWLRQGKPRESYMEIPLITGATIAVAGMDAPERIEGRPLDWWGGTEFANMKPDVWQEHVRPALSTPDREGGAWIEGVPEGRNHFYKLCAASQERRGNGWDHFWWKSADILSPGEIEEARRDMDPLTFAQEYEAEFVSFTGRAYYSFDRLAHARERVEYDPNLPLIFCFDFNVSPGVAVVCQEQAYRGDRPDVAATVTAVIGEVWIPKDSNTPMVCRKLVADWSRHKGDVYCFGDATGGAKGTSQVRGTDWDLIRDLLSKEFGGRLGLRARRANPRQRVRLNAVNSRLRTTDGKIHLLVDPANATQTATDFDDTVLIEGGAGEIDKKSDPDRTHLTDAIGYYIVEAFPIGGAGVVRQKL